jgi:beta-glucosidase/6-phospho-beta-glucosidase/beta-galactosidase
MDIIICSYFEQACLVYYRPYYFSSGITPYENLYHYDLPEELEKAFGGWLDSRIV